MLIAPNGSPPSSSARPPARDVPLNYLLIAGITALVVYTFLLGTGLISGRVPVERAYALMSIPPFVTAVWHLIGFLRQPGAQGSSGDSGLLLGALGWLCAGGALLVMHGAVTRGLAGGVRLDQIPAPAMVWLLSLLAVAGIVTGTALSWRGWRQLTQNTDTF